MTDPSTTGYEAEPHEVEALLAQLYDGAWGDDPVPLYMQATRLEVLYRAAANAAAAERSRQCARMHATGLSYQQIADALNLGTRARAQQLTERGSCWRKGCFEPWDVTVGDEQLCTKHAPDLTG